MSAFVTWVFIWAVTGKEGSVETVAVVSGPVLTSASCFKLEWRTCKHDPDFVQYKVSHHGFHVVWLTNFPDFSCIFVLFSNIVKFIDKNKNCLKFKSQKNKICLKFQNLSSMLCKNL